MSRPTIAGLTEELEAQRVKTERARKMLDGIDEEARAYSDCVNALRVLTKTHNGSYASRSSEQPDTEAIRRVLDALKGRFDITEDKAEPDFFQQDWNPPPDDPRDDFISMLVEALRKS